MKNLHPKYVFVLLIIGVLTIQAKAQNVGIGTKQPDQSAALDIQSIDKGLLIPRMTLEKRNDIKNPANGLLIFQSNEKSGFYFFDGNKWSPLSATEANSIAAANPDNWSLTGNAGTSEATNFIGTTDAAPLTLKVNAARSGLISTVNGSPTLFGYLSGLSTTTGINNSSFGYLSMYSNTSGSHNGAFGYGSLQNNTTGNYNFAMGSNSLLNNTSGSFNMAVGAHSLILNSVGAQNTAIGTNALQSNTGGSNNIGIGYNAGYSNANGDGNIFIGANAGFNETGNGKLYIANSSTTTPLIYGDFSAKFVSIGDVDPAKRASANTSGGYNLLVKGGILTEKVKVALASSADWADYVFDPSYKLMSLEEVESFTNDNKHLPNVPSADEMAASGLDVSATSKIFMEKIEELTLYMIELNKEVKALKAENEILKNKIN
ncbi:hypothetical protein [Jiulongibacter sediminis]|uniref:Peptidase S74 domain-containing protein n=1 Tax=Jiulongibacter sediminis TaxID=1605367 RepID=A0A0N8H9X1_9BACT|nr:hypothetical protein [Jiulongibacter sediminis]KPM48556.1 hypothetical protein AFM12_08030 [Jiulongibacter sediminis]TBX25094.1 hypothetical protein TK44_08035 [Jiulongibacter sediminis]